MIATSSRDNQEEHPFLVDSFLDPNSSHCWPSGQLQVVLVASFSSLQIFNLVLTSFPPSLADASHLLELLVVPDLQAYLVTLGCVLMKLQRQCLRGKYPIYLRCSVPSGLPLESADQFWVPQIMGVVPSS